MVDSLLSIALFAVAGYYLWYVQCTLHIMQARVAFAVLVHRLHSRMLDLATNIRIGRLGGIPDHDSLFDSVRPNGMDHSYPNGMPAGKERVRRNLSETNGGKDGTSPTTVPEEILDRISVKKTDTYSYHPDKRDILFASMWRLCDLIHHFRSARKGANHEVFRAKLFLSGVRSYTSLLYR